MADYLEKLQFQNKADWSPPDRSKPARSVEESPKSKAVLKPSRRHEGRQKQKTRTSEMPYYIFGALESLGS